MKIINTLTSHIYQNLPHIHTTLSTPSKKNSCHVHRTYAIQYIISSDIYVYVKKAVKRRIIGGLDKHLAGIR